MHLKYQYYFYLLQQSICYSLVKFEGMSLKTYAMSSRMSLNRFSVCLILLDRSLTFLAICKPRLRLSKWSIIQWWCAVRKRWSREIPVVDRQDFICWTRILCHFKAENVSFNLVQSTIEIKDLAILPGLDYNRTSSQKLDVPYELLVISSKWYSPISLVTH